MSGSTLHNLTESAESLQASLRLVALPSLGVSRARWLLGNAEPVEVVQCLLSGKLPAGLPDPKTEVTRQSIEKWKTGLAAQDVAQLVARNTTGPQMIIDAGHQSWPFAQDPDPPVLLFVRGRIELLTLNRRVGVVGTRRCSAIGRSVASEIGWTLAEHEVSVVSGLALGVDGAAHRGAGTSSIDPGRIGVVASGLDMVYPARNEALWNSVADTGLLISETPMGERATRWRFPARNRLIAALSELIVVVESHERGGALLTVDEAAARGVDVVAVPGSVLGNSCRGTNQLLMDGVAPVRGGQDIVDLLGLVPPLVGQLSFPQEASVSPVRPDSESPADLLIGALQGGPVSTDVLVEVLDLPISTVLGLLGRLERAHRVKIDGSAVALPLQEGD